MRKHPLGVRRDLQGNVESGRLASIRWTMSELTWGCCFQEAVWTLVESRSLKCKRHMGCLCDPNTQNFLCLAAQTLIIIPTVPQTSGSWVGWHPRYVHPLSLHSFLSKMGDKFGWRWLCELEVGEGSVGEGSYKCRDLCSLEKERRRDVRLWARSLSWLFHPKGKISALGC